MMTRCARVWRIESVQKKVVAMKKVTQYKHQSTVILIIGTPKMVLVNFGKP